MVSYAPMKRVVHFNFHTSTRENEAESPDSQPAVGSRSVISHISHQSDRTNKPKEFELSKAMSFALCSAWVDAKFSIDISKDVQYTQHATSKNNIDIVIVPTPLNILARQRVAEVLMNGHLTVKSIIR